MNRERKRYDAALKAKAALEALNGQRTTNDIAAAYGLHLNLVAQWKKQLPEQLPEIFSGDKAQAATGRRTAGSALPEAHDSKISELPESILKGINPFTFAASVNVKLAEQFALSGLPQTAKELATLANGLKSTTAEFKKASNSLSQTYSGAVADAKRSTEELKTAALNAAKTAGIEAKRLSTTFHSEYRWSLFALTGFALALGLLFGMLLEGWRASSSTVMERPIVHQLDSEPPIVPKHRPKE